MKVTLLLTATILFFASCKTREDIVREKKVETMSTQMQDSQKLNADFTVRLQNLEERLSDVSGKVEEGQHETQQTVDSRIKTLEEKINLIEASQQTQTQTITDLTDKVASQEKYIGEVLGTLKSLSGKGKSRGKKRSAYEDAMYDYKKGRYKSAKTKLSALLSGKSLKSSQKARVIHNMGMISFMNKENDSALSYFSQLFTQYPKSGYNKNGLLFLAKTFKRVGKKEEAKQTLSELVKRWPKASQIKEAKKLLSKL
jgi:TolA-binding protein